MNIFITLDYELFFGGNSGTLENCIIKPTKALCAILDKYGVKASFFVDSGYLLKLEELKNKFPAINKQYTDLVEQIKWLHKNGHDIQLHIHPHWQDTNYQNGKWFSNTSRYKLHDFSESEINNIVRSYKGILNRIIEDNVFAYRAGGWCIQPFSKIENAFRKNNIWLDSTVFQNGVNTTEKESFDFVM